MKMYLVRHGEAVPDAIDPKKPLSPQGRENIEKIARFLGKKSFPLSLILYSQKLRAKETAAIMKQYIAPEVPMKEYPQMAPNDPIEPGFVRAAAERNGGCMLVGHLPYLQKFLGYLVMGNENAQLVRFEEGTTVCVESLNGGWIINWVVGLTQV